MDIVAQLGFEGLSDPRDCCYLRYRCDPVPGVVRVEREEGTTLLEIHPASLC